MEQWITGSCLCGRVAFRAKTPGIFINHCHCNNCRKFSGAAHSSSLQTGAAGFTWLRGQETLSHYRSSAAVARAFCSRCGSPAPLVNDSAGHVSIPAGLFDSDPATPVAGHIFTAHQAPWHTIADNLPRFNKTMDAAASKPLVDNYLRHIGAPVLVLQNVAPDHWAALAEFLSANNNVMGYDARWLAERRVVSQRAATDETLAIQTVAVDEEGSVCGFAGAERRSAGNYSLFLITSDNGFANMIRNQLWVQVSSDLDVLQAIEISVTVRTDDTATTAYFADLGFQQSAAAQHGQSEWILRTVP